MWSKLAAVLPAVLLASEASAACSTNQKIAGIAQELKTIASHSVADAAAIPYADSCYRIFTITPNEVNPISVVVPAGVNGFTTRAILVLLGNVLTAGVPADSVHYTPNNNGTVTVDYVQTDGVALQYVNVREIHSFDESTCEITGITGYVHGNLEAFTGGLNLPSILEGLLNGKA